MPSTCSTCGLNPEPVPVDRAVCGEPNVGQVGRGDGVVRDAGFRVELSHQGVGLD